MYPIDVDFEVYKKLTVMRTTEDVTYNDVIRELLGLGQPKGSSKKASGQSDEDWVVKGVRFPAGTELQVTYKGKTYTARVQDASLVMNGETFTSPSAAAVSITGGPVNGWRFWKCKLPGSSSWQLLETLRR